MQKASGIYVIEIARGSKPPAFYIGQSVDMAERKRSHLRAFRASRHDNAYMLNAFRKYGEEAFAFRTILRCSGENLCLYEQAVLDWYRVAHGLQVVNVMAECIRSHLGVKRRPETILRMSLSQKGRKKSPDVGAKLAVVMRGKTRPEETRRKISESHKKLSRHPNSLAALDAARDTTRIQRLRETLCGKPKVHSEETKQKIAASLRGRASCPEANEKRRQSMLGKKCAPDVVARRVASRLANAAKKRDELLWSQSKVAAL